MNRFLFLLLILWHTVEVKPSLAQQHAEGITVSFGALNVLTGDIAYLGERCRNGMELAKDDINTSGGIGGRQLEIIHEDFGPFDLKKAASAAHKLLSIDKVAAVFPAWIEDTEIIAPLAERSKVPLMTTDAGGVNIGKFGTNVFRASNTEEALIATYFSFLRKQNHRKVALVGIETAWVASVESAAGLMAKQYGLNLDVIKVPPDQIDFATIASKLVAAKKEAVIPLLFPAQFTTFMKQIRNLGGRMLIVGAQFYDYDALRREMGSRIGELVFARYAVPSDDFSSRYEQRYGSKPLRPAGNCYDAVQVMGSALRQKDTDYAAVNDFLRNLKNYRGVTGKFSILPNGDRTGEEVELYRVNESASLLLKNFSE